MLGFENKLNHDFVIPLLPLYNRIIFTVHLFKKYFWISKYHQNVLILKMNRTMILWDPTAATTI